MTILISDNYCVKCRENIMEIVDIKQIAGLCGVIVAEKIKRKCPKCNKYRTKIKKIRRR